MLEAVGVQVASVERGVRLCIVTEFDDLDEQATLFGHLFHHFEDLRVRAGHRADLEGLVGRLGRGAERGQCKRCAEERVDQLTGQHVRILLLLTWSDACWASVRGEAGLLSPQRSRAT